jgi:hypothetical protein
MKIKTGFRFEDGVAALQGMAVFQCCGCLMAMMAFVLKRERKNA